MSQVHNLKGLFIQPAMFDLELEWMVGAGDRQEDSVIFIPLPPPSPLLICDHSPWHKFLSLPSLLLPLKSKMVDGRQKKERSFRRALREFQKVRYFKTCVCTRVIELFPEWLVLNSVLFMHRDLCDLGSQILIRILPKERTLSHADQWSDKSLYRVVLIDHGSENGFARKE